MATKCVLNKSTLSGIADAIRAKGGTTETMLPSQMAAKIEAIPSGGGLLPFDGWIDDDFGHLWIRISEDDVKYGAKISFVINAPSHSSNKIKWGDGSEISFSSASSANYSHTYDKSGYYRVDIETSFFIRVMSLPDGERYVYAYEGGGRIVQNGIKLISVLKCRINACLVLGQPPATECAYTGNNTCIISYENLSKSLYTTRGYVWGLPVIDQPNAEYTYTISPGTAGQQFSGNTIVKKVNIPKIEALDSWMFNGCVELRDVIVDSVKKVFPDDASSQTFVTRYPFVGCSQLESVYVRGLTCAETMSKGVFPWGVPNTTCVFYCKDGHIEYIDGAWTAVMEEA